MQRAARVQRAVGLLLVVFSAMAFGYLLVPAPDELRLPHVRPTAEELLSELREPGYVSGTEGGGSGATSRGVHGIVVPDGEEGETVLAAGPVGTAALLRL